VGMGRNSQVIWKKVLKQKKKLTVHYYRGGKIGWKKCVKALINKND
jgi:hypothetical protein